MLADRPNCVKKIIHESLRPEFVDPFCAPATGISFPGTTRVKKTALATSTGRSISPACGRPGPSARLSTPKIFAQRNSNLEMPPLAELQAIKPHQAIFTLTHLRMCANVVV